MATPQTRRTEPATAAETVTLDGVIDMLVGLAPEAIKRRGLLQGMDWTKVDSARVAAMLGAIEARGQHPPAWLLRALLTAGHVVPARVAETLPGDLGLLNRLNGVTGNGAGRMDQLVPDIVTLPEAGEFDADVLRTLVARLAATGRAEQACALALAHWRGAPAGLGPVRAHLPAYLAALPDARFHVTSFSTSDVLCEDLKLASGACGWRAEVSHSAFAEVVATLLAPRGDVDAHVLLLDGTRLVERDWRAGSADSLAAVTAWADTFAGAIEAYARACSVPLLVNTLTVPAAPTAGWRDGDHAYGLRRAVELVNERLIGLARAHPSVHIVDADLALAHVAPAKRFDAKLWYYGRVAYGAEASRALASGFALCFAALRRGPAKVLAIDLDNTLWGGVYGDDGIERLQCGEDAPGNAFQAFQRECLRLKRQGMILVAVSKNNPDAIDVFARHPGMLLRRDDFTATAINWQTKPDSLRGIAEELRLGLDSFVFLDDSPHEREAVRRLLPQVIVPEMPSDPALRPEWLRRQHATWPLRLTEEDEQRTELYAAETQAKALKATATTFADYLRGLEQRLDLAHVTSTTLARAAQMHQRTNQFNLTTRRLAESEIAAMIADPARGLALLGRVRDKFGDHGITIAATASIAGTDAEIVTLLMSCRVIGREVERAFLGALLGVLGARGVTRVTGRYIATAKNALARDFYKLNGFRLFAEDEACSSWCFNIGGDAPPSSHYVTVALEG